MCPLWKTTMSKVLWYSFHPACLLWKGDKTMKLPSIEEGLSIIYKAMEAFVKEMEDLIQDFIDKLKERF